MAHPRRDRTRVAGMVLSVLASTLLSEVFRQNSHSFGHCCQQSYNTEICSAGPAGFRWVPRNLP